MFPPILFSGKVESTIYWQIYLLIAPIISLHIFFLVPDGPTEISCRQLSLIFSTSRAGCAAFNFQGTILVVPDLWQQLWIFLFLVCVQDLPTTDGSTSASMNIVGILQRTGFIFPRFFLVFAIRVSWAYIFRQSLLCLAAFLEDILRSVFYFLPSYISTSLYMHSFISGT